MNFLRFQFGGKRGYLRPMIIEALQEKPMKVCELIRELERSTMGLWKPSPGSIYPALSSMDADGIVCKRDDGKYEIREEYLENFSVSADVSTPQAASSISNILDKTFENLLLLKNSVTEEFSIDQEVLVKVRKILTVLDELVKSEFSKA